MNSTHAAIGTLAELFTWIGVTLGGICFLTLLILRLVRGHPVVSEAVLADTPTGPQLRWLAEDGLLRSRPLADFESAEITDPDELHVYYRRRRPDTVEIEQIDHAEKLFRMLGLIFLGVTVVAVVVSVVVMLLP